MRAMSNGDRAEANAHEISADRLQTWLWHASSVKHAWEKYDEQKRWSHDDNVAVQHLGWAMIRPPMSEFYDLYSLHNAQKPWEVFVHLLQAADHDPYAAKAVGILTAQRLKCPNVKFLYLPPEGKIDQNPF